MLQPGITISNVINAQGTGNECLKPIYCNRKIKPGTGKSDQKLVCLLNLTVYGLNAILKRELCMVGGTGVPPTLTKLSCLSDFFLFSNHANISQSE